MPGSILGRAGVLVAGLLAAMSLFAVPAFGAAPIVTISSTSNHTLNTATVNGTVNLNGYASGSYKLEYGKTKLYGQTTPSKPLSGAGALPISKIIAGLEQLTTYHVRIKAETGGGTTVSNDLTFEMLLEWKLKGKNFTDIEGYPEWPYGRASSDILSPTLTVKGTVVGTSVEVTCVSTKKEGDWFPNVLGYSQPMAFTGCKTFLNGKESKSCLPATPIVMNLNPVLEPPKGTSLFFGEECAIGEIIPLTPGGFELPAMAEAKVQKPVLVNHVDVFGGFTITIDHLEWAVAGPWVDQPFGIS